MAGNFQEYKSVVVPRYVNGGWIDSNKTVDDVYYTLLYSGGAINNGIANFPDEPQHDTDLKNLAKVFLMLVRALGKPIQISSGYRCKRLNDITSGSSPTSQHMKGQAIDMNIGNGSPSSNWELFLFIVNHPMFRNKYDQVLWEYGGNWVHCSFVVKGDDLTSDASYSARHRITGVLKGSGYFTMKPSTDSNGFLCFDNYTNLNGKRYNGPGSGNFSNLADGLGGGISSYGGMSGGVAMGGGVGYAAGMVFRPDDIERGQNTVYTLGNEKDERMDVLKPKTDRRKEFDIFRSTLIKETPNIKRDVVRCGELYDPSILKKTQWASQERNTFKTDRVKS